MIDATGRSFPLKHSHWACGCSREVGTFKCIGTCRLNEKWTLHCAKDVSFTPGSIVAVLSGVNTTGRMTYTFEWKDNVIVGTFRSSDRTLMSPFTTINGSMTVDGIHDELLQPPNTSTQPRLERAALTAAVTKLRGLQESRACQTATKQHHTNGPKMVDIEDAYVYSRQDMQLAESGPLLQMAESIDRLGTRQVQEMDRLLFPDGTVSPVEMSANLYWGQRDGYPFIISDQMPCDSALSALENWKKDYHIPGWCSNIRGLSNQFAFSVLPLYLHDHRKCPVCPSINRIVKVTSEFWLPRVAGTREFRVFMSALVSQFYDTWIHVGAGYQNYDTILRRAKIHDHGLILICDNENHGGDSTPIVRVEIQCDGFSLSVSGIGLADGIHDFAKGLLCPRTPEPRSVGRILWRSASDYRQGPIKFFTDSDRLTLTIDPSLGLPTPDLEEARYSLEMRLSYERQVRSPQETEHLFKDIRGLLTQDGPCTLEQRLWRAAESIDFIHSSILRMLMIQAQGKFNWPTRQASRPIRDAICLQDVFLHPPQALSEQEHDELSYLRQQMEGNLIQLVQDSWSVMTKSANSAVRHEGDSFRSFVLSVLALLQYFPAQSQYVGHYVLKVVEHGVCLNFVASQQTIECKWPDLERAFRTEGLICPLGLKFDVLPGVFQYIPPFEGLCEGFSPPAQERCYTGRITSDVDLYMLCRDFNNLATVSSLPSNNYVLMRPLRRYNVERNWVYQEFSHPFTTYSCSGEHGRSERSIKIAEYEFGYQWFFFMAVIVDEKSGTTPCQDSRILPLSQVLPQFELMVSHSNKKQNRFASLLSGLDHLVQELHSTSFDDKTLPENLKTLLADACALIQSHLAQERLPDDVVDEGTHSDLEVDCELVVTYCTLIGNLLPRHHHHRLRNALSQLEWHAKAARHSCAPFTGKDFGFERHMTSESGHVRGSLPLQGSSLKKTGQIPNNIPFEGPDADMVWIEKEHTRTHSGMEMEIVPNE